MARKSRKNHVARRVLADVAVQKVATQAVHAKNEAENAAQRGQDPNDYANEKAEGAVQDGVSTSAAVGGETARAAYQKRAAKQQARRAVNASKPSNTTVSPQDAPAPTQASHSSVEVPTAEQRKNRYRRKAYAAQAQKKKIGQSRPAQTTLPYIKERAAQNQAAPKSVPAIQPDRKAKIQALRKQHIIREAVKKHLAKQSAAGGIAGSLHNAAHVAPKLPSAGIRHKATGKVMDILRGVGARLVAAFAHLARAAVESIVVLLGAGGIVLLLALVIGAAAAVIGSPMGILFANESNDPDAIPIAEIVRETNLDFAQAINDLVAEHPECDNFDIQYDYEDGHTWASYWPEVLAVFAVDTNLNGDSDVVVIDEAKKQQIKDTFWEMHLIEYEIEEIEIEPEETPEAEDPPDENEDEDLPDEPAGPTYEYILHITVSSRTVEELAADKHFTQDQLDILHELLSDEMRPTLLSLCGGGGIPGGDGTLQWPLPGYTNLTTLFGEPDAFGRPGHRGIDIPAPEGTPIYAAQSGTVLISGWNDSYGNQVLLDDGAGLSTRYAHMTETAVQAGEMIEQGQIIGYVGSTGDSTGNHLHFEVQINGVLVDPLDYVSY